MRVCVNVQVVGHVFLVQVVSLKPLQCLSHVPPQCLSHVALDFSTYCGQYCMHDYPISKPSTHEDGPRGGTLRVCVNVQVVGLVSLLQVMSLVLMQSLRHVALVFSTYCGQYCRKNFFMSSPLSFEDGPWGGTLRVCVNVQVVGHVFLVQVVSLMLPLTRVSRRQSLQSHKLAFQG